MYHWRRWAKQEVPNPPDNAGRNAVCAGISRSAVIRIAGAREPGVSSTRARRRENYKETGRACLYTGVPSSDCSHRDAVTRRSQSRSVPSHLSLCPVPGWTWTWPSSAVAAAAVSPGYRVELTEEAAGPVTTGPLSSSSPKVPREWVIARSSPAAVAAVAAAGAAAATEPGLDPEATLVGLISRASRTLRPVSAKIGTVGTNLARNRGRGAGDVATAPVGSAGSGGRRGPISIWTA